MKNWNEKKKNASSVSNHSPLGKFCSHVRSNISSMFGIWDIGA